MTPYYDDGQITIYCGDAVDIIEAERPMVGLVVTDPPFFLPARIASSRRTWPRTLSDLAIMHAYYRDALPVVIQCLRRDGGFYTFCDATSYPVFFSILYPLFDRTQAIVWDKGVGGLGNGWRHSTEFIIHGAFARTSYADGFRRDLVTCPVVPSDDRSHPSEKPIPLLTRLISAHEIDDCVLDPFAGTGATLIAAKQAGRAAIGIELEERYCAIAVQRLRQQVLPFEVPA